MSSPPPGEFTDGHESSPAPDPNSLSKPEPGEASPSRSRRTRSQLGDYILLRSIGTGAMGEVFKARELSTQRNVALKVLFKHVATNPKFLERFYREARLAGLLDHPNLVRGFSVNEDHGWHYFAMEYISGQSLQKWLKKLGHLSLGDALHITMRCAQALQYAHEQALVHRDIKPDNILITRRGGETKLADLGMVKQLDADIDLTQTGHAVGTPWYMPMEQAKNAKNTDCRCDIYALGCVFYACLTGQPPFVGRTLVEVIEAKEKGTFPPARQFNREVPESVDRIIAKMTAKLPRFRYQDCTEIIADLEGLGLANAHLSFVPGAAKEIKEVERAHDRLPRTNGDNHRTRQPNVYEKIVAQVDQTEKPAVKPTKVQAKRRIGWRRAVVVATIVAVCVMGVLIVVGFKSVFW